SNTTLSQASSRAQRSINSSWVRSPCSIAWWSALLAQANFIGVGVRPPSAPPLLEEVPAENYERSHHENRRWRRPRRLRVQRPHRADLERRRARGDRFRHARLDARRLSSVRLRRR